MRRRRLGGASALPPLLRASYSEAKRSVLTLVAIEVIDHGYCDLDNPAIAKRAGVSLNVVNVALSVARHAGHLNFVKRYGAPNFVTIVSPEWNHWLRSGLDDLLVLEQSEGRANQ